MTIDGLVSYWSLMRFLLRMFLFPGLAADRLVAGVRERSAERRLRMARGACEHCGKRQAISNNTLCEACWSDTII